MIYPKQSGCSLTVNERNNFADGTADLPQGRGGAGESRASGSSGLGQTLLGLGSSVGGSLTSLGGSLGGGRGVSDNGAPGQELRLPQDGTGGSGHLGECEEEEEGVDVKRDQAQITRDNRWWKGTGGYKSNGGFRLAQRQDQNLRIWRLGKFRECGSREEGFRRS